MTFTEIADMFVKRLKKVVVTEHDDKQLDEDCRRRLYR